MLPDRFAGLLFVALAAGIAIGASQFHVPYQYEPVGPAVFPYLLAAALSAASGFLIVRPDAMSVRLDGRHVGMLGIVLCYAYLLEPLGFGVVTLAATVALGSIFRLPMKQAVVSALLLTLVTYGLLVEVLGLNLPVGWVWPSAVGVA